MLAARAGELALSLRRRFVLGERFVGTLALAPIGGGSAREVAENIEDADWDPSGGKLAVVRSTGDVGGQSRIEYPAGRTLYKTGGSIRFLRVSRDGQRIAFLEDPLGRGVSGRVAVVDLEGSDDAHRRRGRACAASRWSADGDEIWFTAGDSRSNRALRAVNLGGKSASSGGARLTDVVGHRARRARASDSRRGTAGVVGVPPGQDD